MSARSAPVFIHPTFRRHPFGNPFISGFSPTMHFRYPWDETAPRMSLGGCQLA
jgi:hypothetical protein